MSEAAKWDGFPVFGRDRDAWHLLNYDEAEHPVPMWWDWHLEAWQTDPEAALLVPAAQAVDAGYSYLAGTVTPSDLKEAIAEAVAAEREKNLAAVEGARIASDGWGVPIDDGDCERNEGIDLALESIRSAAK